jgi:hypothetical protein
MTNVFKTAFTKYATLAENQLEDNNVNWNFVDADLCMDGWGDANMLGNSYVEMFEKCADQFELNQAADRLDVLKSDYLGQ